MELMKMPPIVVCPPPHKDIIGTIYRHRQAYMEKEWQRRPGFFHCSRIWLQPNPPPANIAIMLISQFCLWLFRSRACSDDSKKKWSSFRIGVPCCRLLRSWKSYEISPVLTRPPPLLQQQWGYLQVVTCLVVSSHFHAVQVSRARIFKLLRSPRIDSKEPIPPGCVAWRAGTTNYFY